MLGVPFDAARELAHAPLPVAELPEPADLRDPSGPHRPTAHLGAAAPAAELSIGSLSNV